MYVRPQLFLPYKIFSLRNVDQTTKYISCHAWKAKTKNQPDGSANDRSKKDAVKAIPTGMPNAHGADSLRQAPLAAELGVRFQNYFGLTQIPV